MRSPLFARNMRVCQLALGLFALQHVSASPLSTETSPSLEVEPQLLPRAFDPDDCRLWAETNAWTTCQAFITQYRIPLPDLYAMNPSVERDCYGFKPGESYCLRMPMSYPISTSGQCGKQAPFNQTCIGSTFGNCCAEDGFCGSTEAFCAIGKCQAGDCPGLGYTTNGSCGPSHDNLMCGGSFGACCSNGGRCENTAAECGVGNCASGACLGAVASESTTSTSATPLPSPFSPSPDGTCGYNNQYKCTGTAFYFGNCCGAAGYCGTTFYECSDQMGCQSAYGLCDKTVVVTVTVSASVSSTTTAPTTPCTTATINFQLSGAQANIVNGEIVHIAGSAPELGSWSFENSIPMLLAGSVWQAPVSFSLGGYMEYKYFWVSNNGTVVWISEPNYSLLVATTCSNTLSVQNAWR